MADGVWSDLICPMTGAICYYPTIGCTVSYCQRQSKRATDNAAAGSGKSSSTLVENDPAPQRPTPATPASADLVARLRAHANDPVMDTRRGDALCWEAADALERQQEALDTARKDALETALVAINLCILSKQGIEAARDAIRALARKESG